MDMTKKMLRRQRPRAAWTVLATLALAACGQQESPEPEAPASDAIAYEGARIIVGDGSVIENGTFTVEQGRFTAVGAAGDVTVPEGATRVDLSGATVMPAIVDAHVHMSTTREALINDLQQRAYFGVGAALSMGSDGPDAPLELRDEQIPNAARFRSAGQGITRPEPGRREVHWVDTVEEARQAVREEANRDVDLIKIWVDDRDGQYDQLTPELYGAIIDEAHQNGLEVAAHIFDLADGKGLLRADVDIFAHGVRDQDVDEEFVDLVEANPETVLIPNLPDRGVAPDLDWLGDILPQAERQQMAEAADSAEARAAFVIQARNLGRLDREGMPIAFGTDGNTPWEPHFEMEDMVIAGMDAADVIVAATRNSAEVLGLGDEMGTIEAGKSADFIVLEANPLEDITNTRRIAAVHLRGQEVDRAALRTSWSAMAAN